MKKEEILLLNISKQYFHGCDFEYDIKNIDWRYFHSLVYKHRMGPIALKTIGNIMPNDTNQLLYDDFEAHQEKNELYIRELKFIIDLLDNNNIDYVLIKGFTLSKRIYDDLNLRIFNDIDILVKEDDMDDFFYIVNGFGYKHEIDYDKFKLPRITERQLFDIPLVIYNENFYEYQLTKSIDDIDVKLEIKKASSGIENAKACSKMIDNSEEIKLDRDVSVRTLDLEDDFLQLCGNCYGDSETSYATRTRSLRLRNWMDVYGFLYKFFDVLSWEKVFERSLDYGILYRVYWVLINISELYNEDFVSYLENVPDFCKSGIVSDDSFAGVPILNNGALFEWKHSLGYRLFNHEENVKEMNEILYRYIYHIANKNIIVANEDKYRTFVYSEEDSFCFKYTFDYHNSILTLKLILDKINYDKLNAYRVIFTFYSNSISRYSKLDIPITFTLDRGDLQVVTLDVDNYNSTLSYLINDLIQICIDIKLDDIGCTSGQSDVAYNIALQKKLLGGYSMITLFTLYPDFCKEIGVVSLL